MFRNGGNKNVFLKETAALLIEQDWKQFMTAISIKFNLISMSKIHIINKQIRSTVFDSGGNKNV